MRTHRRRRGRGLEWCKNGLIVLLALSAVYLALRTGLYTGGSGADPISGLAALLRGERPGESPAPQISAARPGTAALPAAVAVSNGEARLGLQYDAGQTGALFDSLSGVLGEGLSSARNARTVSESAWRTALCQPGIYVDFRCDVPLEALQAWLGERGADLSGQARRLALAHGGGDAVTLYYSNEADGMYYACDTAVSYVGHLRDAVENCVPNGAAFAFEYGRGAGYDGLDPYVMVREAPPSPRVYQAANPVRLEDESWLQALQRACGFPPQAGGGYQSGNTVVIRDGSDSLRIGEGGAVTFSAGGDARRYPAGEGPAAVIEACRALAQATAGRWCGDAQITFAGLAGREDGGWEVRFGYTLDGAAVQLYDEGYAARFQIQDGQITGFTLRLRQYTDTGERSIVLRELRAAAAMEALPAAGRELVLCYEDSGGETIRAGWVAR